MPVPASIAVYRFSSATAWRDALVDDICDCLGQCMAEGQRLLVNLAGGGTPEPVYRSLAPRLAGIAELGPLVLLPGDERYAPQHPELLNSRLLVDCFTGTGGLELIEWPLVASPHESCSVYSEIVHELAVEQARTHPLFALSLLGLGEDGHTAGLFGDRVEYIDHRGLCVHCLAPGHPRQRLSLSPDALCSSRFMRFALRLAGKESALEDLLSLRGSAPAVRLARALDPEADLAVFVLEG